MDEKGVLKKFRQQKIITIEQLEGFYNSIHSTIYLVANILKPGAAAIHFAILSLVPKSSPKCGHDDSCKYANSGKQPGDE